MTVTGSMIGRRAVITGASTGIGRAVAKAFVAEGASVHLIGSRRHPEAVEAAASELGRSADPESTVTWSSADVADHDDIGRAVQRAAEAMGGIDAVFTGAGVASAPSAPISTPLHRTTSEQLRAVLDINLRGTWSTIRHAAEHLEAAPGVATVVTVGSVASKRPSHGAYAVSKSAVWMMTRVMADQWAPWGVRVNCLAPGFIDTPLFRASIGDDVESAIVERAARVPMRRIGTVDEAADAAVFLSNSASSYITGSMLHPDGGLTNANAGG